MQTSSRQDGAGQVSPIDTPGGRVHALSPAANGKTMCGRDPALGVAQKSAWEVTCGACINALVFMGVIGYALKHPEKKAVLACCPREES